MIVYEPMYTEKTGKVKKQWWYEFAYAGPTHLLHENGEADTPESTMLAMMGHVSAAMLGRYSHIRVKSRRDAIAAVGARVNSAVALQGSPQLEGIAARRQNKKPFVS